MIKSSAPTSATYLEEHERRAFRKWGVPVRYIRGVQRERIFDRDRHRCVVCDNDNLAELQIAHRIPYAIGIKKYGYTPEFLNRDENLAVACKKGCNKKIERMP